MTTQLSRLSPLVLYKLKRDYGGAIDIYKLGSSTTNVKTGTKAIVVTVYHIRRAIVLPARQVRAASPALPTARTDGKAGGWLDSNARVFIVDRHDAPETLTQDDWIVFSGRKYQIAEIKMIDSGWSITAKELVGEVPQQVVHVKADNLMDLESKAE